MFIIQTNFFFKDDFEDVRSKKDKSPLSGWTRPDGRRTSEASESGLLRGTQSSSLHSEAKAGGAALVDESNREIEEEVFRDTSEPNNGKMDHKENENKNEKDLSELNNAEKSGEDQEKPKEARLLTKDTDNNDLDKSSLLEVNKESSPIETAKAGMEL